MRSRASLNQFIIFTMKKIILAFACLSALHSSSQSENAIPEKKVKFGFNLGANYSNLKSNQTLPLNASISNGAGVTMGLLMDYAITSHFHISPKMELSFNQSQVDFITPDQHHYAYEVMPVSLDFMTHAHYKISQKKSGVYVLAGPNFKLPVVDKSKQDADFNTKPDFAIDFGIGFDYFTQHFTVAPELRYSYGLLNVSGNPHVPDLNYNKITLVVNFK